MCAYLSVCWLRLNFKIMLHSILGGEKEQRVNANRKLCLCECSFQGFFRSLLLRYGDASVFETQSHRTQPTTCTHCCQRMSLRFVSERLLSRNAVRIHSVNGFSSLLLRRIHPQIKVPKLRIYARHSFRYTYASMFAWSFSRSPLLPRFLLVHFKSYF